jgi:cation transport ATPase
MTNGALLRSAVGWFNRRSAVLLLAATVAGLAAGGLARLAGAGGAADGCWLVSAGLGLAYALWSAADSLRRGRLGVDVIALLALAGAVAVRELLAAAVISVMLASGRALEAWACRWRPWPLRPRACCPWYGARCCRRPSTSR